MPGKYDDFVRLANIKIFTNRIQTEADPSVRAILFRLLAEERAITPSPPRKNYANPVSLKA